MLTGDILQIILEQDQRYLSACLLYQTRRMGDAQHHHPG